MNKDINTEIYDLLMERELILINHYTFKERYNILKIIVNILLLLFGIYIFVFLGYELYNELILTIISIIVLGIIYVIHRYMEITYRYYEISLNELTNVTTKVNSLLREATNKIKIS